MPNSNQSTFQSFFDSMSSSEITTSQRIINTPSDFAKKNLFYIQEVGQLKSLKSHISQREHLNSYLFLIVISGSGKFTYKNESRDLQSGCCLLIDCNQHYSHQSSEHDPWELQWIHFNGKNIAPYFNHYALSNPDYVFQPDSLLDFKTLVETCFYTVNSNDITSEFQISKHLNDLLTLCITKNTNNHSHKNHNKIEQIKLYIDNNYTKKISLSEISSEFFVSKFHLSREFKRFYGITIGDYISVRRITLAKELLRFTDKSIEEIAILCGIPDANYFTKVFHKIEECSPSEFRMYW